MRVFCIWLAMALVLLALGCAPSASAVPDFSYAEGAFTATVRGAFVRTAPDGYAGEASLVGDSRTEVRQAVAAGVEVGAPVAEGVRGMRVTFSEPSVLAGVSVVRETGRGTVTVVWPTPTDVGGEPLVFDAEGAEGLLRFAEALLPNGDTEAVSPVENGARRVTRRSPDGVSEEYVFLVGRALPVHIVVTAPGERLELYIE